MKIKIESAINACNRISREIRDYQKNLTIQFIVHHEGQRTDAFSFAMQNILPHPASETAMRILQKRRRSEESALLGTAVASQNLFFGLTSRDTILSLCTINFDQFNNLKEIQRIAYHLAWHALDAVEYHNRNKNPVHESNEIKIRKRNGLEMAGANLKADIFSVTASALHRDTAAIQKLGHMRGLNTLHSYSLHNPEYYPFIIAMEAAEYALRQIDPEKIPKKRIIPFALKTANKIASIYDHIALKEWLEFAEPAQDMAWRGYNESSILSAAINTSPHTYVRLMGHMTSEVTKISPAPALAVNESYSPFADEQYNERLHDKIVHNIYQDIIAQTLQQHSALPFQNLADRQNHDLTEGKILGWCADALHAVGQAYENEQDLENITATSFLDTFEDYKNKTKWHGLKELGNRVTEKNRNGSPVTIEDLHNLAKDIEGLNSLRQSVEMTIQGPHYTKKMEALQEMAPENMPQPNTPELTAALRQQPTTPAAAMAIPGLGRTTATRPPPMQKEQQETEENQ